MRVTFLFSDNFPGNSAYSNRIHSLSKGLTHAGSSVEVAVVYPGKKEHSAAHAKKGTYDTIKYTYFSGIKYKPESPVLQKMIGVYGSIRFFIYTLLKFRNRPDVIISCTSLILHQRV